jgi:beta-mannosidase
MQVTMHGRLSLLGCALVLVIAASEVRGQAEGMTRVDLGGTWDVVREGRGDATPATVPGCIHTDLLAAKKIPDPFYRTNEKDVQWVGEAGWMYRRSFSVAPEVLARQHVLLRCEGLDTLATITLNGSEIAKTDNMFRTYEFDVKKLLKPGANAIEIKFDSVVPFIKAKLAQRKLPTWAFPGAEYVRKEPCNFGWDWGPTLITCGIWKPIGLVAFDAARLDDVAILQDHSQKGRVALTVELAAGPATDAALSAKAFVTFDSKPIASAETTLKDGKGKVELPIADPKLWWPAGMGAQPLYTVKVELLDKSGSVLDVTTKRIGLRTLRTIEQTKDAPMHFVVNGVPFFAKGANWIPADQFATRVTKEALRRYVADAAAANMNCLRFWGGGYYEEDALYDACDELGICIWLDFKFACSSYPAFDGAFLASVKQEAADNIKRLRHHPSIGLWCGNNEIMYMRAPKWTADKMGADDYYRLFRDTLGDEVRRLAPQSDFVTGSPDCGDVHYWEVWHGGKNFEVYRDIHGFMSEFGFQSFPEPKTVRAFTEPADRESVESHVMKYHERSNRMYMDMKEDGKIGTDKIMKIVKRYFRDPKDFESALWLSQITQAYGIKYGAEGWRREMPKSMGCVYWQYNDTWPGSSWSSVDYFGRWKALHYAAKKFYAPILVSGAEDAKTGKVDVYVASDKMEDHKGKVSWSVTDVAGKKISDGSLDIDIPARKSRIVRSLNLAEEIKKSGANNTLVWLSLRVGGEIVSTNLVTFAFPRELTLVDPQLSEEIVETQGEFVVTLRTEHPALWTWLELDGVDATCSDNFVHVTKDLPQMIIVSPATPMTKDAFKKALRVRSLYDTYAH